MVRSRVEGTGQGALLTSNRDAKGVEVVPPGEAEKIKEVSDQFNRMQMMNFNEHHHCLRGTHLKTQGVSVHERDRRGNLLTCICSA